MSPGSPVSCRKPPRAVARLLGRAKPGRTAHLMARGSFDRRSPTLLSYTVLAASPATGHGLAHAFSQSIDFCCASLGIAEDSTCFGVLSAERWQAELLAHCSALLQFHPPRSSDSACSSRLLWPLCARCSLHGGPVFSAPPPSPPPPVETTQGHCGSRAWQGRGHSPCAPGLF